MGTSRKLISKIFAGHKRGNKITDVIFYQCIEQSRQARMLKLAKKLHLGAELVQCGMSELVAQMTAPQPNPTPVPTYTVYLPLTTR